MRVTNKRHDNSKERGSTLTLFALSLVVIFFMLGISIDLGTAYVMRSRLSKAVDAGVLAGARTMRDGDAEAQENALQIARANYNGPRVANFTVQITNPTLDTKQISIFADTDTRTRFAVMMGQTNLAISTSASATRYPLDMSLSLDRSASMSRNKVFDDMQDAAKKFIDYFDDSADQIGITSYSTISWEDLPVQKYFKILGEQAIDDMDAESDTNIQEGLRMSKDQLDAAGTRPDALRVVVLFTDGRPTAFRDEFDFKDKLCTKTDAIVSAYISGGQYRGLFQATDGRKITDFLAPLFGSSIHLGSSHRSANNFRDDGDKLGGELICQFKTEKNSSGKKSPKPHLLPNTGVGASGPNIRRAAALAAEVQADLIRADGYAIYAIGLGNPKSSNPGDNPDMDLLSRIANVGGMTSMLQPRGEVFFAPSKDELDDVFAQLADRLLSRLTR